MATEAERLEIIMQLEQGLKQLLSINPKKLVRKEVLGEFSFDGIEEPARKMISLFKEIEERNLTKASYSVLSRLSKAVENVLALFSAILNFSAKAENQPDTKREQLFNKVIASYDNNFDTVRDSIALIPLIQKDDETKIKEMLEEVETMKENIANEHVKFTDDQKMLKLNQMKQMKEIEDFTLEKKEEVVL